MWHWINPDNRRYYQADLIKDLFVDWTLVKTWGSLATRRGNYSITGVSTYSDGLLMSNALGGNREKRGYVLVTNNNSYPCILKTIVTECEDDKTTNTTTGY